MKASVIICTYNRVSLLMDSIRSVQAQDFPSDKFEIVVVDNNSTDGTADAVKKIAANSPVVIKYLFEGRQGLSHARNTGIGNSEGEITVFTDDDIEAERQWLRELTAVFDSPDVWAAGGPIRPVWPSEAKPAWLHAGLLGALAVSEFLSAAESGEFKYPDCPWGANMAFRRDGFRDLGLFPSGLGRVGKSLLSNEEINLCKNIGLAGKVIRFAPNAVIHHKLIPEKLRKSWFLHRYYWQGRSEAIMDEDARSYSYRHLRRQAEYVVLRDAGPDRDGFDTRCYNRTAKGYLYQLIFSNRNTGPEKYFRIMRLLENFLSGMTKTAAQIVDKRDEDISKRDEDIHKRDQELRDRDEEIQKRDEEIRRRDEEIRRRDEDLRKQDRYIQELLNSWSWRITKPLRWALKWISKGK